MHILGEIKRTADLNGGIPLGRQRFYKEAGIRVADGEGKFWVSWGDAIREAGLYGSPDIIGSGCIALV
jgi:hypothetical protein